MLASVLKFSVLILLGIVGCLPDDEQPDTTIPPPPHPELCGNGKCEPSEGENNVNCVKDCPNCYPILATRSDSTAPLDDACGAPRSGKSSVAVAAGQELVLTFGREMVLGYNGTFDLALDGEVTGSAPAKTDTCPAGATTGAVEVLAAADDRIWKQIGWWFKGGNNQFSLRCATQLNSARSVKLYALPDTTFKLNAAHALSCYDK